MCYNTGKLSPKFYFHENQILYCTVIQSIAVNMCVTWLNPYRSSYLSRAPEIEESGKIFQLHEDHPFLQRPHVKSKEAFSWPFEAAGNSVFIPWTAKFYRMYLIRKEILHSVGIIGMDRLNCWIKRHLESSFQYRHWAVPEQIWNLLIYILVEWVKPLSKEVK